MSLGAPNRDPQRGERHARVVWARRVIGLVGLLAAAAIFAISGWLSGLIVRSTAVTMIVLVACAVLFLVIILLGQRVQRRR